MAESFPDSKVAFGCRRQVAGDEIAANQRLTEAQVSSLVAIERPLASFTSTGQRGYDFAANARPFFGANRVYCSAS